MASGTSGNDDARRFGFFCYMIIARLWGGLGNQLFQYAAGYALARERQTQLLLDPTQCWADKNRPYELNHFGITGRIWREDEQKQIERLIRVVRPADEHTGKWARQVKRWLVPGLSKWFYYADDRHAGYQPEIATVGRHIYLAGTWANEEYFKRRTVGIRKEFRFVESPDDENRQMLDRIEATNAICVHVRRGDYVAVTDTRERFGVCSPEYYGAAMHYVLARVEDPTAYVFSDDPAWAAENLRLPCPTVYVSHNCGKRNHEDLRLMAACQHFVIANSTFSWWAAWLSKYPGKVVVAPKQWSIASQGIGNPVLPEWVTL